MADEKPTKSPKVSAAAQKRWDRYHSQTIQEQAADRDLKEARIEEIVQIMRPFAVNGKLCWDREARLKLGRQWGLTDLEMRRLTAEASRRIREDVDDPDELRRSVGESMLDQLAYAHSKKNVKDSVAIAAVLLKMADGPSQRIEVTVETKLPTAADAAQAVRDMFGVRVTNAEPNKNPVSDPGDLAKPTDGTPSGTPEG